MVLDEKIMSSVDDTASDTEEFFLDIARKVRKPELQPIGECYSCGERVSGGHKFCDADCATDYQRIELSKKRDGRS